MQLRRGTAVKLLIGDGLRCAHLDGQYTTFGAVEACMAIWRKTSAHSGGDGGGRVGRGLFFFVPSSWTEISEPRQLPSKG